MTRTFARTLVLIIAGLAIVLLAGMCSSRVGAAELAEAPTLVTFHSRIQTNDRVTMVYALTATGTVTSVTIDGPCLLDAGGIAVRYIGNEQITLLETGFAPGLDGATIAIKYAPTKYTVVGFWVSAAYPGGLAENSRWAMFPLWAYTEGNPTPYTQTVPQCDAAPVVLPLITAGPAHWDWRDAWLLIPIALIFILLGEANRPRPPK